MYELFIWEDSLSKEINAYLTMEYCDIDMDSFILE